MDAAEGRTGRPFVSLTMIVKNEEADLARCLASARAIADELIVVDTGSTDRTVEIAREHGANVHFFPWCDDFAAARNAALSYARGEWVLHLDADEVAVESAPGAVRAELARVDERVLFLRVPVKSLMPEGLGYDIYGARRLFRNRPEVRWFRPIHENIAHVDGVTVEMESSCGSLVVEHDGYANPAERQARGKNTRNMRLLRRELKGNPNDPTLHYYMAVECVSSGQAGTALRIIRKAIRRFGEHVRPDFLGAMYCLAMRCAMAVGKPNVAIDLGTEAAKVYAFSELCYLLGCAYQHTGDLVQAERYHELAIVLRNRFSEYQMDAGTGSWKALIELGAIAWAQGDSELALERTRRAYECMPEIGLTNFIYGKALLGAGRAGEAVPFLRTAVELAPDLREAHLRLSQALAGTGDHQEAYERLDRLVAEQPEYPEYWQWLGDFLYECEEYAACADVLGRAIDRHQNRADIYMRLAAALRQQGRYQDALNAYALASALEPESVAARAGLALSAHAVEWNLSGLVAARAG